jgi:signal transduction histidine kinase
VTAAEVYLPCDVGHVRVNLGFGDTLSPLEETALRVILALSAPFAPAVGSPDQPAERGGASTAPDAVPRADIGMLATLLGLGYRVVLDLVHDLWRAGYLAVDFGTNAIWLTQEVQEKLASGQLATLRGAQTEDCTAELMVERLTGHVMYSRGPLAPADPRLAVRFLGTDTGLAEASHADIHQAVRDWLGQERQGRQRRILSIRSAPVDRSAGATRRWYQLGVQAELNPDTDDLVITVTDRRFPAGRRDRASDRLTRLAQEKPLEEWVIQLRNAAERRLVAPQPAELVIGQLAARIASGMSVPAGKRRAEHLEWAHESRRIAGLIHDRITHEAEAELVVGGEAHAAAVSRLIDEARTQLVLVCPRIADIALERLRPQLRAAVDRGVQVVILWGGEYKATLRDNVRNALDSLARRARTAPMLRAQVSANTDVRMVIRDNRAALVTSRDLLATARERAEIGILLRRPDARDSAVLSELLGWARVNMPGSMSTSVLRHADRFDGTRAADPERRADPARERLPEEPPEESAENGAESGAVRAWVMRWEAHLTALRTELASRPLPAVRLVEDGAHRELLWYALRRVQRRVVVASGQLSDEVINSRMIDAITMLLARGVAVTIGYDQQAGADRGKGALAALADLTETYPTLLTVSGAAGHTRALVWDDDVSVGSYSYLFHAGYGTVGGRYMLPSELSVRLTDPVLADQVAAACGEPPEVTARVSGQAAAPMTPAPQISEDALAVAQRILNRAGDPRPGELVRAELRSVPDPWPVLDLLDRLADPALRRTAIAYCLTHGEPDAPTAARWRGRLVVELVRGGLFTEARILRAGTMHDHGPPEGTSAPHGSPGPASAGGVSEEPAPRPKILAALSRRGQPDGDVLLEAACEDDLTADERAALRAACVGELLESGSTDAKDALEMLAPGDGPWGELAGLAITYHENAAEASTGELMREVSRQHRVDTWLDGAWDRLEIALIEAEPVPKALDGAKKTKAALYKDSGVLGRLRNMAARRDLPALRTLVTAEFPARPRAAEVAGDLLDRTWRTVAPLSDLLDGRPRAKYIKRLAEVVSAARDLAAAGEPAGVTADGGPGGNSGHASVAWHPVLLAAAGELAESYQRLRPALENADDAGPLAVAVANDVLPGLDRLMSGLSAERETADAVGSESEAPSHEAGPTPDGGGPEWTVVPRWQRRWQYPELAAALWAGEADPAGASALLLRDLVEPLPPAQTARRLIKDGEFAAVEALRVQATLPSYDEPALLRELQEAQAMAGARARYEAAALIRRARRVGLDAGLDAEAVSEQAQQRWAVAERALTDFRRQVIAAEDALAEDLETAVKEHPAVRTGRDDTGTDAEAVEKWRRAVLACVEAREFPSARHTLDQGPDEAYVHDPRIFAPPRPAWPFPADIPETVVSWYLTDGPGTPAMFGAWRPFPGDDAAWEVLKALSAHLAEPSARSATVLRDKLQRLVGANHQARPMAPRGQAWTGRLYLPDSHRLPRLSLLGRDGIALWVADSGAPPEGLDDAVIAWLVTDFGRLGPAPAGTMIIDLPFLFRLLAPDGSGSADPEARLVNLVRHLSAQLDAQRLIGDAQPPFKPLSETDVAWLLDLLGARSDGVVADALHFDTGGRREILVPLLDELLPPPVAGRGRYHRLDVPMLNEAWDTGSWRAPALGDLLGPLHGESATLTAALTLAWVAAAFHDDAFGLDDLPTGIGLVATAEKQAETFLRSADLGDAARQLVRVGIFTNTDQGRWRLPGNGIRELLAGMWPGHDPVARAQEAIESWFRHHERAAAQSRAELSDRVVRTIGHRIANWLAAVHSARERNDPELAWRIVGRIDSVHDKYREALSGDAVLSLWDILVDRKGETEFMHPAFRVTLPADSDVAGLCVVGNGWLLGQAFQNLFDNARQAFEKTGREFGEARVTVTPAQPPLGGAERTCLIDIADDGTGMDARARAAFAAGEECTTWGGRGTGLMTARRWFEEYRGSLVIMKGTSGLGGAWVRVTLPLATASGAEASEPGQGGSV